MRLSDEQVRQMQLDVRGAIPRNETWRYELEAIVDRLAIEALERGKELDNVARNAIKHADGLEAEIESLTTRVVALEAAGRSAREYLAVIREDVGGDVASVLGEDFVRQLEVVIGRIDDSIVATNPDEEDSHAVQGNQG